MDGGHLDSQIDGKWQTDVVLGCSPGPFLFYNCELPGVCVRPMVWVGSPTTTSGPSACTSSWSRMPILAGSDPKVVQGLQS